VQTAGLHESIERAKRHLADPAVGHEVGIVAAIPIECGERALEEGRGDRRAHVGAGIEQLGGKPRAARRDLIEARAEPVQALVDCGGFLARQLPHRSAIAVGAGDRFGDPETGRSALVGGMIRVTALPLDQCVDQLVDVWCLIHSRLLSPSRDCVTNTVYCRKAIRTFFVILNFFQHPLRRNPVRRRNGP
jgi:hypothetical protein